MPTNPPRCLVIHLWGTPASVLAMRKGFQDYLRQTAAPPGFASVLDAFSRAGPPAAAASPWPAGTGHLAVNALLPPSPNHASDSWVRVDRALAGALAASRGQPALAMALSWELPGGLADDGVRCLCHSSISGPAPELLMTGAALRARIPGALPAAPQAAQPQVLEAVLRQPPLPARIEEFRAAIAATRLDAALPGAGNQAPRVRI